MLILPGVQVSPSLPGFIVYPVLLIIKSAMAHASRATSGRGGRCRSRGTERAQGERLGVDLSPRGGGGVIVDLRQIAVLRCGIHVMKGMREDLKRRT